MPGQRWPASAPWVRGVNGRRVTWFDHHQVILNGSACTSWRLPSNNDIAFDFPRKSIIFE